MAELGLCINAKDAVPDAAECAALGLGAGDWIRTHLDGPLSLLDGMLAKVPADVSVMVTLNNQNSEVGWDWSGWENACTLLAQSYAGRVKIVGCGNELDLWHLQPPVGDPDPRVTPAFAASLVVRAAPILHDAGIQVAMSSVASGAWPDYLYEMAAGCWQYADYCDLHLYVKELNGVPVGAGWQTAGTALSEAARIASRPAISSEGGIKVDNAGGLEAQAKWVAGLPYLPAELVCCWCWHDRMASPGETGGQAFGARGLDGKRKPLWFALQKLFGGPANRPLVGENTMADYQLGIAEKVKALRAAGVEPGRALEDETYPYANSPYSYQMAERGLFVYSKAAKKVVFLESR